MGGKQEKSVNMNKPLPGEYNPYFDNYIRLVPEGDFSDLLKKNTTEVVSFFKSIPPEKHSYAYAAGKWSVKEVLMHLIDVERVMCYRALVGARGDNETILYPFDEDAYQLQSGGNNRTITSLIDEFAALRKSSEIFFETLTYAQSSFQAKGVTHPFTARALGYVILGHAIHHVAVVKERYL